MKYNKLAPDDQLRVDIAIAKNHADEGKRKDILTPKRLEDEREYQTTRIRSLRKELPDENLAQAQTEHHRTLEKITEMAGRMQENRDVFGIPEPPKSSFLNTIGSRVKNLIFGKNITFGEREQADQSEPPANARSVTKRGEVSFKTEQLPASPPHSPPPQNGVQRQQDRNQSR